MIYEYDAEGKLIDKYINFPALLIAMCMWLIIILLSGVL